MCSRTVAFDCTPRGVTCWKDTIAVGLKSGDIITLDGITGSQTAILSGHSDYVRSLVFSPDGTSLVSGSNDKTVKLWDIQTGGVIKTFYGHTHNILSVSIPADFTRIASGSMDHTIRLWNIQTEECNCIIEQQGMVDHIMFSPIVPQHLISVSGNKIWKWDIDGHQVHPPHDGSHITFSLDGTQVVSCYQGDIVVQNTDSGAIVAKFQVSNYTAKHCCFSPNGKLITVAAGKTAFVWDTTSLDPHPIKTLIGHATTILSLAFSSPSSLVSSDNKSVKFWQIGTLPTDPVVVEPISLLLAQIMSITLQVKDGVVISSHYNGVVSVWDISTGLCKASFQTPARSFFWSDAQLINNQLIFVWYEETHNEDIDGYNWHSEKKIHIWGAEKGELQAVEITRDDTKDIRISGDGSKVFCLYQGFIQAFSIQTGEIVGEVGFEYNPTKRLLTVDGSRAWVYHSSSGLLGWDFGTPETPLIQLITDPPPHLDYTRLWDIGLSKIKDRVTGKVIFQLGGRFAKPTKAQWDGQYLVAGYDSGELLILDFNHLVL